MGRKNNSPIQFPFALRSSDPALAQWAFQVVRAIKQLASRISSGGSGGANSISSSNDVIAPLTVVSTRPRHIPAPVSGVADGYRRFYFTMGSVNGIRLGNYDQYIDLPVNVDRWIVIQVTLPSTNSLTVSHCEWVVGSTEIEYSTPDWPNTGSRPGTAFKLQATWHENILSNAGAGNLQLTEVVSDIRMGASMGESLLIKQFFWSRENYG